MRKRYCTKISKNLDIFIKNNFNKSIKLLSKELIKKLLI